MPDVGLFSFLRSVSPLLCERRRKEEQLSGLYRRDLRRIVPTTESIPKLLFKGDDSNLDTDSSEGVL